MGKDSSRRNSINSTCSQGNSSIASAHCADDDTHAIVQRETDKQILLVSLASFINFGKVIKVGQTATFKNPTEPRKSERGKVLVFGTEELCLNQYEILKDDSEKENRSTKVAEGKKASSSSSTSRDAASIDSHQRKHVKQNKSSCTTKKPPTLKQFSQKNVDRNQVDNFPSTSINTTSSICIEETQPTRSEKSKYRVKRQLFSGGSGLESDNDSLLEGCDINDRNKHTTTSSRKKQKTVQEDSQIGKSPVVVQLNREIQMKKKVVSADRSSQARTPVVPDSSEDVDTSNEDQQEENEPMAETKYISLKKYHQLEKNHQILKKENEKMKEKIKHLQKKTIPMPNSAVQSWVLQIAKIFSGQLSAGDIDTHARLLGNLDPKELLLCLGKSGTHSTRNIIRLMYSTEELMDKSGPETVSPTKRKLIRDFVELRHGVVEDRDFNEAIDGVFRYTKQIHGLTTKADAQRAPGVVKNPTGQQQSIKKYCLKTSKSDNQQKKKKTHTFVTTDSDDSHF